MEKGHEEPESLTTELPRGESKVLYLGMNLPKTRRNTHHYASAEDEELCDEEIDSISDSVLLRNYLKDSRRKVRAARHEADRLRSQLARESDERKLAERQCNSTMEKLLHIKEARLTELEKSSLQITEMKHRINTLETRLSFEEESKSSLRTHQQRDCEMWNVQRDFFLRQREDLIKKNCELSSEVDLLAATKTSLQKKLSKAVEKIAKQKSIISQIRNNVSSNMFCITPRVSHSPSLLTSPVLEGYTSPSMDFRYPMSGGNQSSPHLFSGGGIGGLTGNLGNTPSNYSFPSTHEASPLSHHMSVLPCSSNFCISPSLQIHSPIFHSLYSATTGTESSSAIHSMSSPHPRTTLPPEVSPVALDSATLFPS